MTVLKLIIWRVAKDGIRYEVNIFRERAEAKSEMSFLWIFLKTDHFCSLLYSGNFR